METLDEKLNGVPIIEVDEPVSVQNCESFHVVTQTSLYAQINLIIPFSKFRYGIRSEEHARPRA